MATMCANWGWRSAIVERNAEMSSQGCDRNGMMLL
jgi:hypothetical protein